MMMPILFAAMATAMPELRVCADPNNLPFSNRAGEGFENKIVELIAADLGMQVSYTWWAQRRGNIRETLNDNLCDLIPGIGSNVEMAATTRPYYRSTYVAVTKPGLTISSFDDPRLARLRIGVQMIGDDFSNTPPAHALTRRGIVENVRGYMIYGDYRSNAPQASIIDAVADGQIDVAYVWGPLAGYFAGRKKPRLNVTALHPAFDGPEFPMMFDISMGVRKTDTAFKRRIEQALDRNKTAINTVLKCYDIPLAN